ncbi:hypothetical protein TUM19329_10130 [Legionella antarctica]|uniref:N-acetyltransferase domain-containing protein n=1 Tax=Legionella antarctica TaxID=2708020 RepID=A0A6F8T3Q2_9GAMM|nr:GNAT family N-acetyltransferase [Legionella antarctica]BCA94652.1 hypothetical protein TUM19329_10130 [Legionella antarctica]
MADTYPAILTGYEFTAFCKTNKDKNCDTLLFTGGHGESNNPPFFNNLRKAQIDKIIKVAKDNNVTFDHIVADCCCAPYGLNQLKGLLADGGELIGDRTTSTSHWNHTHIMMNIDSATSGKKLMLDAMKYSLISYNAPLVVIRDKNEYTELGTSIDEVYKTKAEQYRNFFGGRLVSKAEIDGLFPEDALLINNDMKSSAKIFTFTEFDDRQEMIKSRDSRLAAKAEETPIVEQVAPVVEAGLEIEKPEETFDLVSMEVSDIATISVLDKKIFPDEEPLGDDRLRSVCQKGVSSVIKSHTTDEIVGYVFVNVSSSKLWIDNIGVSLDYTRRGLGSRLLNAVLERADKENKDIGLQVRSTNQGAIALYKKLGFNIQSSDATWAQMARAPQPVVDPVVNPEPGVDENIDPETLRAQVNAAKKAIDQEAPKPTEGFVGRLVSGIKAVLNSIINFVDQVARAVGIKF